MKNLRELDRYRCREFEILHYGRTGNANEGVFLVPLPPDGEPARVIASNGMGWDHVSVSLPNRCPTWAELEHVKRLFFRESEVAVQFHVPPKDHISVHPYCLHLWRCQYAPLHLPPPEMVG